MISYRGPLYLTFWASIFVAFLFSAASIVRADPTPIVTLSPIAGTNVVVGDTAAFTASATDSDASSTIAYALTDAPVGALIDPVSGAFSWNTTGATTSTYTFVVTATGSTGGSDHQNVSIILSEPANSVNGSGGTATSTGGTIITGDATASSSVDNQLNISKVKADNPNDQLVSSTFSSFATSTGDLQNTATSTATTGDNTVVGGNAANTIVTGNAFSTANVINEVNTNIFNSDGLILFLNQLFGGGFDLNDYNLEYFFAGGPGASPSNTLPGTTKTECTLLTCLSSSALNVINTNTATVTNSVIVRSATGGNTASSTGNASIDTGDAYAAANVLNLVNTNIINSSYLLLSFNNFGDLHQDVTLPSNEFFDHLLANGGQEPTIGSQKSSTYTINDTNTGTTTASVTADAGTGNNLASTTNDIATSTASSTNGNSATGTAVVSTGNAYSSASSFNQQNTNSIGGTSVFLLFRVSGTWSHTIGDIHLPAGLTATTTPDGIEVYSSNSLPPPLTGSGTCTYGYKNKIDGTIEYSASSSNPFGQSYDPLGLVGGPCFRSSTFLASSTNKATLDNTVSVSAQTGDNTATTNTGTSTVKTGNAYAAANVVNLVNTNIVGQNWIFGVFNIFGNWDGNIVFAGPNLAISAEPSTSDTTPGSDVTYKFDVTNSGKADASNVSLNATFPNDALSFAPTTDAIATSTPTGQSWSLGLIPRGATRTFAFTAHVGNNFPAGQRATVRLTAAAVNNSIASPSASDPVDTLITVTSAAPVSTGGSGPGPGGGSNPGVTYNSQSSTSNPNVLVVKTVSVSTTTATTTANYQVVVTNDKKAGPVFNGILTDTLYNPSGGVMYNRSWDLATIAPGDEITLTYSVAFAASSTPGLYHNVAKVTGEQNYSGGPAITPVTGTGDIQFTSGHVLGVATSTSAATSTQPLIATATSTPSSTCTAFLSTFLSRSLKNDSGEVQKLQQFLNSAMGANLPLTGFFGPLTQTNVKVFQIKSGIKPPSGAVYALTQRAINESVCGGPVSASNPAPLVNGAVAPAKSQKAKIATSPKPVKKAQASLLVNHALTTPSPAKPTAQGGLRNWLESLNLIPKVSAQTR